MWQGLPRPVSTYVGLRVGMVFLVSAIAYVLPEFELLVALVGSIGASMLAFVIPGVLGWAMYGQSASALQKGRYVFLVLFGVVGGTIGASYALHDLVHGHSQC